MPISSIFTKLKFYWSDPSKDLWVQPTFGAYFISQNCYPIQKKIYQGDDMGRANRLTLKVDENQKIFVGGNVIEVGKGELFVSNL